MLDKRRQPEAFTAAGGNARTRVAVMDETFNLIAEKDFQGLSKFSYLINKDGLFLQVEKGEDENELKFVKIEIR